MFAHYFKQGQKHYLIICTEMRPVGQKVEISGKAEAKRLAKQANAKPWNF